jgi:tRNA threonylcarbamoyladenosine biosynthesis protein TsaE
LRRRTVFLIEIVLKSPDETFDIGRRIAARLSPGSIVALNGVLGSGKTYLTKGIALGLGINENITSPTYTIINEYEAACSFYHIDTYRLNDDKDFEDIGGNEIIESGGICVIEWSEKIPRSLPDEKISIYLEITGHSSRLIRIEGLKEL